MKLLDGNPANEAHPAEKDIQIIGINLFDEDSPAKPRKVGISSTYSLIQKSKQKSLTGLLYMKSWKRLAEYVKKQHPDKTAQTWYISFASTKAGAQDEETTGSFPLQTNLVRLSKMSPQLSRMVRKELTKWFKKQSRSKQGKILSDLEIKDLELSPFSIDKLVALHVDALDAIFSFSPFHYVHGIIHQMKVEGDVVDAITVCDSAYIRKQDGEVIGAISNYPTATLKVDLPEDRCCLDLNRAKEA